ncbi:MAG: hypothetical protein JOS17DRAFT_752064 [Linnemannia elongata]|nr:MAG: hypothetical protein JOS17DRAFT_752064 [Linnemannia elongata]
MKIILSPITTLIALSIIALVTSAAPDPSTATPSTVRPAPPHIVKMLKQMGWLSDNYVSPADSEASEGSSKNEWLDK